jgi:hypothetical protein
LLYYEYSHDSSWAPPRDPRPTPALEKIESKKSLVSIIRPTPGIHSLFALPAGVRCNAKFLCASVLPDIERNSCHGKHRKTLRGINLHLDNARAHNAKWSQQKIARTKANRVADPAYSLVSAPSDFFLFGDLKGKMARFTTSSAEDILSEIRRIFDESPREIVTVVYDGWITRLE